MKKNIRMLFACMCTLMLLCACSSSTSVDFDSLQASHKGDTICLGSKDKQPLEWVVLDEKENCLLVLATSGIGNMPIHEENIDMTWENCSLRTYLNEEFMNTAFSEAEKEIIQEVDIVNDETNDYNLNGGNNTKDHIFVLSSKEVEEYLTQEERTSTVSYWTRTPGYMASKNAVVSRTGEIEALGSDVSSVSFNVRPAMWIKVKE